MQVQALSNFYEVRVDNNVVGYIFQKSLNEWVVMCPQYNKLNVCRKYADAISFLDKGK